MREKYESLSLATLKELAKARGLKGISTLRKPALIERMLQEDEKERKDTGAISETVQKEEIREEKKDRQEEHQTPVRQYRQNGHVQESRAFYDNRRKNNWQEGGTRTYNSASEGRRYGNSQSEFSKNHGSQNDPSFPVHAEMTGEFLSPGTCVIQDAGYRNAYPDQIGRAHV